MPAKIVTICVLAGQSTNFKGIVNALFLDANESEFHSSPVPVSWRGSHTGIVVAAIGGKVLTLQPLRMRLLFLDANESGFYFGLGKVLTLQPLRMRLLFLDANESGFYFGLTMRFAYALFANAYFADVNLELRLNTVL
ncbi:hypothetical protein Tco_0580384 [Tanacetum coccineum]